MSSENKYWRGIEEVEANAATVEQMSNEFSDKLPMEEILGDTEELSSNRRDFLKFFGFSVSAVALAACNKSPVKYAMPYVNKPEEVTPGLPLYYATSSPAHNEGYPVMAKVREGRPIKLDGNSSSDLSQSGLSALGQASILSLYDVNRLKDPVVNGDATEYWASVDGAVADILKGAYGSAYVVTRSVTSPVMQKAIDTFVSTHGAKHVVYDPISYSGILSANEASFGSAVIPGYNFDKADVIVSFAADFLGTWVSPTKYTADYSKNRVPSPEHPEMSKHYQIESLMSLTGTNADYRYTIPASKQGLYLVSLHNMVASRVGGTTVSGDQQELPGNALAQIADELVAAKGKALVVCGSNDAHHQTIVNSINSMLNSYGNTIDLNQASNVSSYTEAGFEAFVSDVTAGNAGAVVFVNCNPVYSHTKGAALKEALSKTAVISTSMVVDETTTGAQVIAPDNHPLESWNVFEPVAGYYVTAQPVITKVFNTRSAIESLRAWSGEKVANGEDQASRGYVSDFLGGLGMKAEQAFHDGVIDKRTSGSQASFSGDAAGAASAIASAYSAPSGFELELYQKTGVLDGTWSVNPWAHELPDPVTKVTYDNYVTMSRHDAETNGWEQGDFLKVTANGAEISQLPLLIQPGQARGVVGIALGYGRNVETTLNNDLTDLGQNAYPLASVSAEGTSYSVASVSLEKVDSGYEFAQTQTHHMIEGRDYMREATLDEYKENNNVRNEHKPHLVSLWEDYDYSKGHHWAMAIDMNACTGCGSCIVSCSIENNVPVVGRDEVRRRREMHWLRIDRYYSFEVDADQTASVRVGPSNVDKEFKKGQYTTEENDLYGLDANSAAGDKDYGHYDNVKVVHQPVMCQHCDHAPCETVCPVLATTHSSEGLNQMTYNRCIGTKYCGNNCPYKVRRFNWFRYNKNDKYDYHFNNELGRMVLNPDVTVRSRGVMEKCSFCVQNIQMAKLQAKMENRTMEDGDVTVACAKACPSNAIVFGDRNDPNSEIAKAFKNERSYKMLEEIGTDPSVLYMTKVRNRNEVQHS